MVSMPATTLLQNKRLQVVIGILLFVAFAGCQFYLLCDHAESKILPGPPLGMDQVVYLFETYKAALIGQASGPLSGLAQLLSDAPAAGIGLQMAAYVSMLVNGISRMSALAVNFAYFVAVPGLLSLIIGRDKPFGLHLFLWGLWLAIQSMYGLIGGPFDFRLDFAGMALFALACALLWRTDVFTRPALCILTGLVAVLICITRFIIAIHLAMTGAILLVCLLICPSLRTPRSTWRGVALTLVVAAAGVIPYVALQWSRVWEYYVVGHVTGPEGRIREIMQGFSSWRDALAFYPDALVHDQLGEVAGRLIVLTAVLALVTVSLDFLLRRRSKHSTIAPLTFSRQAAWAALIIAASALGPYITLNADAQKSSVVANVFIVPAGGVAVAAFLLVAGTLPRIIGNRVAGWTMFGLGALAFATGVSFELKALSRPTLITEHRADFATREQMLTLISKTANANGWRSPLLFVDQIGELDGLQMELSHFEKYETDLPIQRLLAQIAEVPPQQLWPSLLRADFLIIRDPTATKVGPYPFDAQMARLNRQLQEFCRVRCHKLGSFTYFDTPMTLYERATEPYTRDPESWSN
jgi:hypothetical protein